MAQIVEFQERYFQAHSLMIELFFILSRSSPSFFKTAFIINSLDILVFSFMLVGLAQSMASIRCLSIVHTSQVVPFESTWCSSQVSLNRLS